MVKCIGRHLEDSIIFDTMNLISFDVQKIGLRNVIYVIYLFRYDPATDTWTQVACLNVGCDSAGVSLLGDRLFCVGGYDGQTYLDLVHAYDPQTNEWTQVRFALCVLNLIFIDSCIT